MLYCFITSYHRLSLEPQRTPAFSTSTCPGILHPSPTRGAAQRVPHRRRSQNDLNDVVNNMVNSGKPLNHHQPPVGDGLFKTHLFGACVKIPMVHQVCKAWLTLTQGHGGVVKSSVLVEVNQDFHEFFALPSGELTKNYGKIHHV